jgi:hypothetical protein
MKTHFSNSVSALAIVAVFAGALCISGAALACGCGGGGGGGGSGGGGGGSGGGGGGSGGGGGGSGGGGGAGGGGGGGGAGAGGGGGGADAGGGGAGGGDSHAELNGPNFSGSLTAFSTRRPYLDPAVQTAYIANFGRRSVTGGKFDGAFDSIGAVAGDSAPPATAQATADDGRRRNPGQSVALQTGRRAPTGGKFDARLAGSGLAATAEASSPAVSSPAISREALADNTGRPHPDLQSAYAQGGTEAQTAP